MSSAPTLYVVIPCYNEEEVLPVSAPLFLQKLRSMQESELISRDSRILFVDDGSRDKTWEIITRLAGENEIYCGIQQSRNRGHQNAVYAGLMAAKQYCDITISIDCDGQDDINAMDEMVKKYGEGYDVVYGVRNKRDTDTFMKRFTARFYYKFLNKLGGEVVYDHADYRLLSSRVVDNFSDYREVNLFLRGLIPLVGFKSTSVYYDRIERMAGKSHYPLSRMATLAIDGITSLSIKPIRLITTLGFITSLISVIGIIWVIIGALAGNTISGWASMVCAVFFIGGVQLISIGVIGEYIGKIYLEVKHRPRYIISDSVNIKTDARDD